MQRLHIEPNPNTDIEDWDKALNFEEAINYLVDEGFIELEEDDDGNIRAYPTS